MQGHRRHNHDSHNNQRSSNQRRSRYDHAGSMYNSDYEDHPSGREFRKVNPPPSSRNRRGIDRRRRDYRDDRHYDYYDYDDGFSDDYFSEEFNEWSDGEYSECFDSSAGAGGRLRRRVAQRRGQGDVHESRSKGHGREAGWKPLRSDAKGGARLRPAIPVNLDDPRDSNDVLPRSAHRSHRGSISGGSDVSENAKNAKPRSQFGRMLANMKRQAAPGSSMAESRAEIEDEIEESGKADNIPLDNESAKEGAGEGQTNGQAAFEASADAEPEMRSAAATPVTAPVAVA
ncbi:hypothetical protein LPJ75_004380 [Coemansia sp. RSA 2598]|nr:hypothetical protein LPJ75_004380 [Coemansia sp. RSA 2598]